MRISDWSSDVCSSDLVRLEPGMLLQPNGVAPARVRQRQEIGPIVAPVAHRLGKRRLTPPAEVMTLGVHADQQSQLDLRQGGTQRRKIGSASCRERVCQYV